LEHLLRSLKEDFLFAENAGIKGKNKPMGGFALPLILALDRVCSAMPEQRQRAVFFLL